MGLKLISNWQRAHRMISVQLIALTGALQAAWPQLPPDMKATLPPSLVHYLSLVLLGAAILGRLLDQGITTAPPDGADKQ